MTVFALPSSSYMSAVNPTPLAGAGESRRLFGRRRICSASGRRDRADIAVTEPGVNQAEDAAVHQVTDQAGEHGRSSGRVPVNPEAHAHEERHQGKGAQDPPGPTL